MRGKQTVRDMVLSLAVIGVAATVIYYFTPHGNASAQPVTTVNYGVELAQARRVAPYPVEAPAGLPVRWRATSVTYDGSNPADAEWHLGFLDPENQYVAIEQSNGDATRFVADQTVQSQPDGSQKVGGQTWQRYDGGRYRALVRQQGSVTTIVMGTAPYTQLAQFAGALRATGGGAV